MSIGIGDAFDYAIITLCRFCRQDALLPCLLGPSFFALAQYAPKHVADYVYERVAAVAFNASKSGNGCPSEPVWRSVLQSAMKSFVIPKTRCLKTPHNSKDKPSTDTRQENAQFEFLSRCYVCFLYGSRRYNR